MSNNYIKKEYIPYYSIIMLSMSLILSYIEAILPGFNNYMGVKIGLANIITLISLHILDIKWTLIINILRVFIMALIFPNLIRFILSFTGFLVSFIIMCIFIKVFKISIITSSIFGAVSHNISQLVVLSFVFMTKLFILQVPIYTFIGILCGLIIGIISDLLYKKISKLYLNNN